MLLTSDYIVQIQDAEIYQEQRSILKNISFNIAKGEFVYLIGRTGSGKTSLLRTLYADLPLKNGNCEVAGFQIHAITQKQLPLLRRRLGIIFQDFQLFYDRSVLENLLFVTRATGWKDVRKMKARVWEVLVQVGLQEYEDKMPHQLSGGEQQRLVIARALINEPLILLADEPTGNLDPEVSQEILKLFLKINKSGTAIFMATHDYQLIEAFPARTLSCMDTQVKEVLSPKTFK